MNKLMLAGLALAAVLAVNTSSSFAATAADMKACATQWDALKTANKVPAGTTWPIFEKDCLAKADAAAAAPAKPAVPAAKMAAPAAPAAPATKMAAPAVPAPAAPAAKMAAPAAPAVAGQPAEQSRIKACAVEWDAYKLSAKRDPNLKWPQFWHDCDVRMKAAGK